MTRLASMIGALLLLAAAAGAARAGEYYERVGNHYRPSDGAWYSSTCCYKKIIRHITITKEVWVKVPPPKPHRHPVAAADDEAVETPRPAPHRHPQVVEMGEVFRHGGACRKAVPVRDGTSTIIVIVNVRCR